MSEELEGKLKVGLLGVIAVTLIVQTFMMTGGDRPVYESVDTSGDVVASNNATNMQTGTQTQQPVDLQTGQTNITPPTNNNATATADPSKPSTTIQFQTYDHDFGTVEQNSSSTKTFQFTNSGTNPLVITNAKGSCGCTVPDWPKEPILPGATGEITVTYNPGMKEGDQNNTVTITANTNPPSTIIRIKANVVPEG